MLGTGSQDSVVRAWCSPGLSSGKSCPARQFCSKSSKWDSTGLALPQPFGIRGPDKSTPGWEKGWIFFVLREQWELLFNGNIMIRSKSSSWYISPFISSTRCRRSRAQHKKLSSSVLWGQLFSRACYHRGNSNGFKLQEGTFRLDIMKNSFSMSTVKQWHRLPGELVDVPSLQTFQVRLHGAPSNLM